MKSKNSTPSQQTPDLINAIGRLLSDPVLRANFSKSPRETAGGLGLSGNEIELLAQIDVESLDRQAETLLQKRWHEVTKLLPNTIAQVGDEAETLFRYFATNSWPEGHLRHFIDAHNFVSFLEENQVVEVDAIEKRRARSACNSAKTRPISMVLNFLGR